MAKRKLKNIRPKALFGSQEAATLAAAGITAAATTAAAAVNARATEKSAQTQAQTTMQSANKSAESLRLQNENSRQLQEESMEFTKTQNEENRALQQQIQMNLQMLAGQQNNAEREAAARIQVKKGGSRKKLKNIKTVDTSLRGSSNTNLPFTVTDGGGVSYMGTTSSGEDLYEILGNDHDHYHKTQGGKNKTGVGIKFANGDVIEGEGNQNTNQGELLLVSQDDAKFISKHSLKGFNPTKAVLAGMNPNDAFAIQETIKDKNNINNPQEAKLGTMLSARNERLFQDWWSKVTKNSGADPDNYPIDYRQYFKPNRLSLGERPSRLKKLVGGMGFELNNPMYGIQNAGFDSTASLAANYLVRPKQKHGGRIKADDGYLHKRYEGNRYIADPDYPNSVYDYAVFKKGNDTPLWYYNPVENQTHTVGDKSYPVYRSNSGLDFYMDEGSIHPIGDYIIDANTGNARDTGLTNLEVSAKGKPTPKVKPEPIPGVNHKFDWGQFGTAVGAAGINALGNGLGAWLTSRANNKAQSYISQANLQAAQTLADAYSQMRGVDMSTLKKEDYAPAHAMAAIRTPYINSNPELTAVNRSAARKRDVVNNNTLSGAARYSLTNRIESDAYDQRAQINSANNKMAEGIKQSNAESITKVANENADRDVAANKDYTTNYLALLQYNNDIENQKVMGIGQTWANAITGNANLAGSTMQSNANSWASALANSGQGFANQLSAYQTQNYNLKNALIGASVPSRISYYMETGNAKAAYPYYMAYKNSTDKDMAALAESLGKRFGWSK